MKPMRPCKYPGCGALTERAYCAEHAAKHAGTPRPRYHEWYNTSEWRRARRAWLNANPWCAVCGEPGNVVDHIQPHKGDRGLFWGQGNWQTLCERCHAAKSARETRVST